MPKHTHTHPLKLTEKPAALVSAPRLNLVRNSGVLTPSDNGKDLPSWEWKFLLCLVLRKADDQRMGFQTLRFFCLGIGFEPAKDFPRLK